MQPDTTHSRALAEALARLPHGPEFRFVDRLIELEPGARGAGEYVVRGDEPFLRGHFPGAPMFPGVLLVEAAAQVAGVVAQSSAEHAPVEDLKLTALRHIKILGTARPGETLRVEARITGRLGGLIQAETEVRCGERLLMQGQVTLGGRKGGGGG
ncbi:beta-hydroxyacyl-ACP dehydratase [Fontisphaera persica]|uniref:3-hydroxyacyl-ACP dehydratase FabZ family protein n=1 Tax=Fontisphaera persica TaxID=2974023 RepID=UPI0024BF4CAA|nr:beta-hydroxyacyl-ACP dehydratase [Fontisphaera persica]WCJ58824.1 beta-hydroxyacyl-ACP dehydratase [Fontisphaera persica]